MKPVWTFAPNTTGESEGPNNPGISSFTNDRAGALVREFLQNSIDARASEKDPVVVSFSIEDLPTAHLDLGKLVQALEASCQSPDNDKRHKVQFHRGLNLVQQSVRQGKISALVASDYACKFVRDLLVDS